VADGDARSCKGTQTDPYTSLVSKLAEVTAVLDHMPADEEPVTRERLEMLRRQLAKAVAATGADRPSAH
jgi:hypothetical protein